MNAELRTFDLVKLCKDKLCRRSGERLPLSDFPRNRNAPDERCIYCRECSLRRTHEYRERRREIRRVQKLARPAVIEVKPKPKVLAEDKVRQAIEQGAKTIEQIHRRTRLDYDALGEVLAVMTFDSKTIRIERLDNRREFVIAVRVAA